MIRRIKFFLGCAFLAAATSLVYLVRYSMKTRTVVDMDIKQHLNPDKYFAIIKDKLAKGEEMNSIKNMIVKDMFKGLENHQNASNSNGPIHSRTATTSASINPITKVAEPQAGNVTAKEPSIKVTSKQPEPPVVNIEDPVDRLIKKSLKSEKDKKEGDSEGDAEGDADVSPSQVEDETPTEESEVKAEPSSQPSSEDTSDEDKELCPSKSDSLVGPVFVNQNIPKMEELEKHFSEAYGGWVKKGGAWKPTECKARTKVALIVPFRKRYEQLGIFVRHMHPILKRQNVEYRILIIEQSGDTPFNRAILFNIGYKEALKLNNFDCFIFHDVDLIPEDDRNMYSCPTSPRHMSIAVDKFNYHLPYASIFGGAGAFKRKDFEEINGFSNKFWGWGGEDDDLYQRITAKGYHLTRPSLQIGRYKMIRLHHHQSSKADPNSGARIRTARLRMLRDGLNSLKYKVLKIRYEAMCTIITIAVSPKRV